MFSRQEIRLFVADVVSIEAGRHAMKHAKILAAALLMMALAPRAFADVVTDWNAAALDAIRLARTAPPSASRVLACSGASQASARLLWKRQRAEFTAASATGSRVRMAWLPARKSARGHS
jgi:hypothetical protein